MRKADQTLQLSATDLSNFLGCRHRTGLDLSVANGKRQAPTYFDPALLILRERGLEHERHYAESQKTDDRIVVDLSNHEGEELIDRSLAAIRAGAHVILQPALRHQHWFGRPDVLQRVDTPSAIGNWSYEALDTKLAEETRGATVLQLVLYTELLSITQQRLPDQFHVVTPDTEAPLQSFRVQDYTAYFRFVRARLETTTQNDPETIAATNYPEPVTHCDICRWWATCDQRRRTDDHLSLVAGVSRLQSRELKANGIDTLTQLATLPIPLPFTPRRGAKEIYTRVREQARVQLQARTQGILIHERLDIALDRGLARLPTPSPGDLFLDIEGDPFARERGGREYLFGLIAVAPDGGYTPHAYWATADTEERAAFETVIDQILAAWNAHPDMHIYHYAPYEPATLKRLMGRYATREAEIDRLLRAEKFVDLYAIVRHAVRCSVERYSIKDLEPFYNFKRTVPLDTARTHMRVIARALELNDITVVTEDTRAAVQGYNLDDCASARSLRDWLEHLRAEIEASGTPVPRPVFGPDGAPSEKLDERAQRVAAAVAALTADVPPDSKDRTEDQQARWLLAQLLDWHRREDKAPWWEFFRLADLTSDELFDEKAALSGLVFQARVGGTARSPIDRYAYPLQEAEIREGDTLNLPDLARFGTVHAIDRIARTLDVKKAGAHAALHPQAVFAHSVVPTAGLADALMRIADDVIQNGITGGTQHQAARELLCSRRPRLRNDLFASRVDETPVQFAIRIASQLDHTVLAIQGPPGAGKTFTAAHMICDLVARGAKVGVTAVSHKVIRNLLVAVDEAARDTTRRGTTLDITCVQKVSDKSGPPPTFEEITDNEDAIARLHNGSAHVLGATQWLWARPDAHEILDVLFVDEAGQMSLANVLAASQSAKSVVLLGDPQQLEQPQQGTHPEGAGVSALEHILQGSKTIPADRGIFLEETWRLPPTICAFTSEVFYDNRLHPRPGNEHQRLIGTTPIEGAGLWIARVPHEGNQNYSLEEVALIERLIDQLLRPGGSWSNAKGDTEPLDPKHILVVAPYNAQVARLDECLASRGIRVGTVDRFQGQQAPIVIYSMTTSTPEDAPRGMEFLYSLNRLNVATSRARCACILVASPRLLEPECQTPRQMQLANAICRYAELATSL